MYCKCGCGKSIKKVREYRFTDKRDGKVYVRKYKSKGYLRGHNSHRGRDNGMYGRKRSEAERKLISLRTKEMMAKKGSGKKISQIKREFMKNPYNKKRIMEATLKGRRTEEFHKLRSQLSKEIFNREYVKDILRVSIIKRIASGEIKLSPPTKIEVAVRDILIKNKIDSKEQEPVENRTIADFVLDGKKIIYCDGQYWHNKPKQKIKDKQVDIFLKDKGYKVLRLKEIDIKHSLVEKRIVKFSQG